MATTQALTIRIAADANGAISAISQTTEQVNRLGQAGNNANAGVNRLTGGVSGLSQAALSAANSLTSIDRAVNMSAQAMSAMASSMSRIETQLSNLSNQARNTTNSFGGLNSVLGAFGITSLAQDILKTNIAMEQLHTRLEAIMGSANVAAQAFNNILQVAKETPQSVEEISKAFIMLKNFGIEPTMQVMQDLTNMTSRLGGQSDTLTGITLALGQAFAKGKLQAQDTNQMIERGVPVYSLLSKELDKTSSEIFNMQEKGELTRPVIEKLIHAMGNDSVGASTKMMETLGGKINMLGDAWHKFEVALLNDQSQGLLKRIVTGWTLIFDELAHQFNKPLDAKIADLDAKIKIRETNPIIGGLGIVKSYLGGDSTQDLIAQRNALSAQKLKAAADGDTYAKNIEADKKVKTQKDEAEKAKALNIEKTKEYGTALEKETLEIEEETKKYGSLTAAMKEQIHAKYFHKEITAANTAAHKSETAALSAAKKEQDEYNQLVEKFKGKDAFAAYNKEMAELYRVQKSLTPDEFITNQKRIADEFEKNTVDLKTYNDELERHKRYLENVDNYNSTIDELTRNKQRGAITEGEYGLGVAKANAGLMNDAAKAYPDSAIKNIPVEKAGEVIDKQNINESAKSLKELTKYQDDAIAKFSEIGNSSKMAFDGLLGGISAVASAFSSLNDELSALSKSKTDEAAKYKSFMDDAANSESDKAKESIKHKEFEASLNDKTFRAEISGARQIAGATSKLFSEKSAARKAFHAVEMGMSVIEMAMAAKKMIVDVAAGAANMFAQGGFAGFAGVAAMAAVMGGLGYAMSGGSGKVTDNTTPATKAEGTVLGEPTTVSNSLEKIIATLNEIHYREYPELKAIGDSFRGVDRSMVELQKNIARSTANFGDMSGIGVPSSPTGAGKSQNPLGSGMAIAGSLAASTALGATGAMTTAGLYAGAALVNAGATSLGIGISTAAASSATLAATTGAALGATGAAASIVGGAVLGLAGGLIFAAAQYGLGKLLGIGKVKYQQLGEGIVIESGKLIQDGMATAVDAATWRKDLQTVKGWFSDKKTVIETYGQISGEMQKSLNNLSLNLTNGVVGIVKDLNLIDALGYKLLNQNLRPSLKIDFFKDGKRVEDTGKLLENQINAWMDRTAKNVFGALFEQYQKLGEGMMETAARLTVQVAGVKGAFKKIGFDLGETNLGMVYFSDTLSQVFASSAKADDGLKNFMQSMNDIYNLVATKGRKSQDAATGTQDYLKQIGASGTDIFNTDALRNKIIDIENQIVESVKVSSKAYDDVAKYAPAVKDAFAPDSGSDLSGLAGVFKSILGSSDYSTATWDKVGGGWTESSIRAMKGVNNLWDTLISSLDSNRLQQTSGAEKLGGKFTSIAEQKAAQDAAQVALDTEIARQTTLANMKEAVQNQVASAEKMAELQNTFLENGMSAGGKIENQRRLFSEKEYKDFSLDLSTSSALKPIIDAMKAAGIEAGFTAKAIQEFVWQSEDLKKLTTEEKTSQTKVYGLTHTAAQTLANSLKVSIDKLKDEATQTDITNGYLTRRVALLNNEYNATAKLAYENKSKSLKTELINALGTDSQIAANALLNAVTEIKDAFVNFTDASGKTVDVVGTLVDLTTQLADAKKIKETSTALSSFSDSLKKFKQSLLTGELSTLSPVQKYRESRGSVNEAFMKIMAGEGTTIQSKNAYKNAVDNFQGYATAFLEQSKKMYASGANYQGDYAMIFNEIDQVTKLQDSMVTDAQKQLDALTSHTTLLTSIDESLKSITVDNLPLSSNSNNSGTSEEIVLELKALRIEVEKLRKENAEHTGNLIKSNFEANAQAADSINDGTKQTVSRENWNNSNKAVLA